MATSKKPRKKYNPSAKASTEKNKIPTARRVKEVFRPIETFYQQIISNEVLASGTDVLFADWHNDVLEVRIAMEGWCICIERLATDVGRELRLIAMRKMGVWLSIGTPIPESLVVEFRAELDECIAFYSSVPVYQINRSMMTEQLAVELGNYEGQ